MHSKLEKLCPSLKQMDYSDFMNFLRVFFGLTNLWVRYSDSDK